MSASFPRRFHLPRPSRSARSKTPDFLPRWSETTANNTAGPATQCRSNPVSGRNLPKTGVFQMSAGDYWLFRSENAQNRSPETNGQFAKAAIGGPFCEYQG